MRRCSPGPVQGDAARHPKEPSESVMTRAGRPRLLHSPEVAREEMTESGWETKQQIKTSGI